MNKKNAIFSNPILFVAVAIVSGICMFIAVLVGQRVVIDIAEQRYTATVYVPLVIIIGVSCLAVEMWRLKEWARVFAVAILWMVAFIDICALLFPMSLYPSDGVLRLIVVVVVLILMIILLHILGKYKPAFEKGNIFLWIENRLKTHRRRKPRNP